MALKLFVAMGGQLLVLDEVDDDDGGSGKWRVDSKLQDKDPQCTAVDTFRPNRAYCGTFEQGLWLTDDSGKNWTRAGEQVIGANITSVAVSSNEQNDGFGVVYVGTEPSMLYRSKDGGQTWERSAKLSQLPSAKTWSFPPKPDTHHVRNIAADPARPGLIYLAIEAGALIRSHDGGRTWKDRVEGGPYDTHTLATNRNAPGRLYSAAGDGYFESRDYGETWQRSDMNGLEHNDYLYSVAVHPSGPDTVLVSASQGPWTAYDPENAESYVYRKVVDDDQGWKQAEEGLPRPRGTTVSALAPNPDVNGEFYAANNVGIYQSKDAGHTWKKLAIPWPQSYKEQRVWSLTLGHPLFP